jgi:glutathione-independent formaldehyde dehydrogenase
MVRGRTTAPPGLVLGHEITGEVIEFGSGVEFVSKGDLVSVPFNVACGRCRKCKERRTDVCLNVNPSRAGGAYGYVDLGGWVGGQAEYVMVPYADWNLLKFPDKDQALAKIRDLTCLSDILPTGYHGCVSAGVTTGSTVLISGAGPGRTCGGIRGIPARGGGGDRRGFQSVAARARPFVRLRNHRPLERGIDRRTAGANPAGAGSGLCGGLRGLRGEGTRRQGRARGRPQPANGSDTRSGAIGIPGLYVTEDPGAKDSAARSGNLTMRLGLGWAKSHSFTTGQTPVMKYLRGLMAILHDRIQIAKAVNVELISLGQAPEGYQAFDSGVPKKFVIDPHHSVRN